MGLFRSQSQLLCQESFNSGLLECHSSVSPRPYRSSHLYKHNCFAMQCGESYQTNRTTEGWRYARLLGIFLLTSPLFLSVTYKVSLNTQQDRTLLYRFSPVEKQLTTSHFLTSQIIYCYYLMIRAKIWKENCNTRLPLMTLNAKLVFRCLSVSIIVSSMSVIFFTPLAKASVDKGTGSPSPLFINSTNDCVIADSFRAAALLVAGCCCSLVKPRVLFSASPWACENTHVFAHKLMRLTPAEMDT